MRIRVAAAVFAVAAAGALTLADLARLDRYGPIAQLVALRPHVVTAEAVVGAGLALVAARRPAWRPAAAGVLAVVLLGAAQLAPRAVPDRSPGPAGGRTLTVLAFNVYAGRADLPALVEVIRRERPDLVSLPEAGADFRARLAAFVEPLGYRAWSSTPPGTPDVIGVSALAATRLGPLSARVDRTRYPGLELRGGALGDLRFVAFHAVAPVDGGLADWRADLARLPGWCASPAPVIVAGDFNATLDHSVLRTASRGCADAAEQRGAGLVSTWSPEGRRPRLGIQIDHILISDGMWAERFAVLDLPGSDHRAVLARIRLAEPAGHRTAGPGPDGDRG